MKSTFGIQVRVVFSDSDAKGHKATVGAMSKSKNKAEKEKEKEKDLEPTIEELKKELEAEQKSKAGLGCFGEVGLH